MLHLESVSKVYKKRESEVIALHTTSFDIPCSDYVAIIGPSGSGKTTLLSMLGAMSAPSKGKIWLDGESIYDLPIEQRAHLRQNKIGFVFQTFNLIPYLTAIENVQAPLALAKQPVEKQKQRAEELLDKVGLADRMNHKPDELSIGQQQRVALARMLANDPAIILADEPTGNLDPETKPESSGPAGNGAGRLRGRPSRPENPQCGSEHDLGRLPGLAAERRVAACARVDRPTSCRRGSGRA